MRQALLTWERRDPDAAVLVVTNMWPHAENPAYGIFVRRQVESLVSAGLRCDVLFVRGYRSPLAYVAAGARMLAWNVHAPRRWKLVHGHGGEVAFPLRLFVRAPVLVSYCGDDLLGTPRADGSVPPTSRIRRALQRLQTRVLTATITKSREMANALPAAVVRRNLILPNGVDTATFAPVERGEARRQLGWDPGEPVALFAADPQVERKRHWLAIAACEAARDRVPGLRLHVAAGVEPAQMPLLMSAADCLLLTSSIEGSPNVVKEALMCALPVVATRCGDVAELLEGVEPSAVIVGDAAGEIADALVVCLSPPCRSNGRQASARLSQEAIAQRLLDRYRELAPCAA
jgi:glycosyltransferase involved in cell wall biosynthesis